MKIEELIAAVPKSGLVFFDAEAIDMDVLKFADIPIGMDVTFIPVVTNGKSVADCVYTMTHDEVVKKLEQEMSPCPH